MVCFYFVPVRRLTDGLFAELLDSVCPVKFHCDVFSNWLISDGYFRFFWRRQSKMEKFGWCTVENRCFNNIEITSNSVRVYCPKVWLKILELHFFDSTITLPPVCRTFSCLTIQITKDNVNPNLFTFLKSQAIVTSGGKNIFICNNFFWFSRLRLLYSM